mmetsp:Transcript_9072/g.18836  ORF Transcript_9072/g.18836 Transcript_9072/m.18836 type:complete len:311 (-) Transcript_9072:33-965(-)
MKRNPEADNTGQSTPQGQGQQGKPRDGPATAFEADPMVSDIFTCPDGDYFGLVLVTNWPISPLSDMDGPYTDFLEAIKSCFQKEDITATPSKEVEKDSTGQVSLPPVYFYPTIHLHITLATFIPPTKIASSNSVSNEDGDNNTEAGSLSSNNVREAKKAEVLKLLQSASELPGWPTEPLQMVVDSAQIGKRAGILLWKDLSGGVEAIRNCLRKASTELDISTTPNIPGIIHSTFLRFSSIPQTPGAEVQEAFRSKIRGRLGTDFFRSANANEPSPLILRANTARLVCESTPYMHISDDDEHVLWNRELAR